MESTNKYKIIGRGRGRGRGGKILNLLNALQKEKERKQHKDEEEMKNLLNIPSPVSGQFEFNEKVFQQLDNHVKTKPLERKVKFDLNIEILEKTDSWKKKVMESTECTCESTKNKLICEHCQSILFKKPQIPCQVHKNTIHLMDYKHCPYCKKEL